MLHKRAKVLSNLLGKDLKAHLDLQLDPFGAQGVIFNAETFDS